MTKQAEPKIKEITHLEGREKRKRRGSVERIECIASGILRRFFVSFVERTECRGGGQRCNCRTQRDAKYERCFGSQALTHENCRDRSPTSRPTEINSGGGSLCGQVVGKERRARRDMRASLQGLKVFFSSVATLSQ